MTSKGHHKHAKLARPVLGNFARHEWAILGAPCSVIEQLAGRIAGALGPAKTCAYVDARHEKPGTESSRPPILNSGAVLSMTTASDHIEVVSGQTWNAFRQREIFREMDLVLVNGNHHQATAQIVIIDPAKADSLQRRLDQMTRVELVLFQEGQDRVFDFLLEKMPELSEVPTFQLNDIQAIVGFLESRLAERAPLLNGLVLAGGQSLRMGRDKGTLDWHGQPQRDYLAQLIRPFCSETYLSCREDQASMMPENVPLLFDSFTGLGPFGAILSAFRERPDHAWLVVACDLPLLDAATLQYLTDHRTPGRLATAFRDADEGLPEPLIAIWEPAAYPVLLSFLAQGYSCPRKVLIQSNTLLLDAPDPKTLTNVNTPEDADKVRETLQRQ